MKPKESAGCHQTLSCRWGLGTRLAYKDLYSFCTVNNSNNSCMTSVMTSVKLQDKRQLVNVLCKTTTTKTKTTLSWLKLSFCDVYVTIITVNVVGVSLITGLECETVEWKLKWNGESTQLQLLLNLCNWHCNLGCTTWCISSTAISLQRFYEQDDIASMFHSSSSSPPTPW